MHLPTVFPLLGEYLAHDSDVQLNSLFSFVSLNINTLIYKNGTCLFREQVQPVYLLLSKSVIVTLSVNFVISTKLEGITQTI